MIQLTNEFKFILDEMYASADPMFITGDAGSGKSTLVNHFCDIHKHKKIVRIAPTGIAATNIKGSTIHGFFKFPPRLIPIDKDLKISTDFVQIYKSMDYLIIDEISMVRVDLMEAIDRFLRQNIDVNKPFGGKKVIMVGDLNQLPPIVSHPQEKDYINHHWGTPFFFSATVFKDDTVKYYKLTNIFRQSDPVFIDLLNKIKNGDADDHTINVLNKKIGVNRIGVVLCPTNTMVEYYNELGHDQVQGVQHIFEGSIENEFDTKNCPVDRTIIIKEGAQVLLCANNKGQGYFNGSVGTFIGINQEDDRLKVMLKDGTMVKVEKTKYENVRYKYDRRSGSIDNNVLGSMTQYPIKLGYAITIHKSQGMTLDEMTLDIGSGAFDHGQLYVALSRARSLDGLLLMKKISSKDVILDKRVKKFLDQMPPMVISKDYQQKYTGDIFDDEPDNFNERLSNRFMDASKNKPSTNFKYHSDDLPF